MEVLEWIVSDTYTLAQRKEDGRAWLKVVNPALGWCHVAAGTLALRIARNSTSTPYNKRTHVKEDTDS